MLIANINVLFMLIINRREPCESVHFGERSVRKWTGAQSAHDKVRCARNDKRIGADASHALPPLPFQPNRRAHRNSEQQADGKVKRADSDHIFLRSDDFEE